MFACGIDAGQIKKDLVYKANEVVKDVNYGMRRSLQNLFGACDITQDGGVDFLASNVHSTGDQLLGKAPSLPLESRARGPSRIPRWRR